MCLGKPFYNKDEELINTIYYGCRYIIKFGLTSPELFLRRVTKRELKSIKKNGFCLETPKLEHAVSNIILRCLQNISEPLMETEKCLKIKKFISEDRISSSSEFVSSLFMEKNERNDTLKLLFKMIYMIFVFEEPWFCYLCRKELQGNQISQVAFVERLAPYILREKPSSQPKGHWFYTWEKKPTDIDAMNFLINNCMFKDTEKLSVDKLKVRYCDMLYEFRHLSAHFSYENESSGTNTAIEYNFTEDIQKCGDFLEYVQSLSLQIFSGCGNGNYDIWGEYQTPQSDLNGSFFSYRHPWTAPVPTKTELNEEFLADKLTDIIHNAGIFTTDHFTGTTFNFFKPLNDKGFRRNCRTRKSC